MPGRLPPGWPNAEASRFLRVVPHEWHVQVMGEGSPLLLLHGAGGSSHSWRDLMPLLARRWQVIAPDLPGQGFTRAGGLNRRGLDATAEDLARLCAMQGWRPAALIGHSAGAAVALRLAEILHAGGRDWPHVVGINAALGKFEGLAGWLFPLMARMLALNPLAPLIVARGASSPERVRALIGSTGSTLDERGLALYAQLVGNRAHVAGTLQMMAAWRLDGLLSRLPQIAAPCLLLAAANDRTVPPAVAARAAAALPDARLVAVEGLGHLAHEEAPERIAAMIEAFLARSGTPGWNGSKP